MTLDDEARAELRALDAAHRLRVPRELASMQGATVTLDGRTVASFASNDYLGLAADPRLIAAAQAAIAEGGAGVGASRLIIGNHREHVMLEREVAEWQQRDGVRLFNSGYAANVGVLQTVLDAGDVVFSDALNHASIIDGCRLSRAQVVVYPHRDLEALAALLADHRGRRRIVVSESLFSMDGDIADVAALAELCRRHAAALMLDEAHAVGVFGPEGRGIAAELGVVPDVLIGTFGKALGGFGAFAATSRAVAELLWNRARTFVFSTGLPPSVPATARAAIALVRSGEGAERRAMLVAHARRLRARVSVAGGDPRSAIAPIVIGDDRSVMQHTARLFERGLFVQGIRPPTVPEGTARLRVSLSAAHTTAQIDALIEALS